MKYAEEEFRHAVTYYKRKLKNKSFENAYIYGIYSQAAFLSIGPLSKAIHDLGKEVYVKFTDKKKDPVLFGVWEAFADSKSRRPSENGKILNKFIDYVDKKTKGKFRPLFKKPELVLETGASGFEGDLTLDYRTKWFKKYKWKQLNETAKAILNNVLKVQKSEVFSVGFELVPKKLEDPLEDYLDSYAICLAVIENSATKQLKISSSTLKDSMLDAPERVSELATTLLGCELSKEIDEKVFVLYREVSDALGLSRIAPSQVVFGIRGKGYHGRHYFGEAIGYPTPNKKSRWTGPGALMYKFPWHPQSHVDDRDPVSRIGFTSTVPLDIFIDSVNIDYKEMRDRNAQIIKALSKSVKVVVKSKRGSNFEVGLVKNDGTKREIKGSNSDARYLIDPKYKNNHFGMMANIPGGEAFMTPEYVKGRIVGDVVINLDKSYRLSSRKPLIIDVKNNKYSVVRGQKKIIEKIQKKRKEAWSLILEQEKNKSVPKEIIFLKKKNFDNIGEFAINTNPKARLCDYLIVNEKIANMIHVALGSGFEPDKATEYHSDIVIDSPRQKLDIWGEDEKGTKYWVIKEGKFVV